MKTLKEIIRRYMAVISLIVMVVILAIIGSIETFNEQKRAVDSATQIFHQIGQTLKENEEEIEEIREEYSRTCLNNVEMIAYLLQIDPSAVNDIEGLKQIAEFMDVELDLDREIFVIRADAFMREHARNIMTILLIPENR